MTNKLLGSAPDLDKIKKMIGQYYYSHNITLKEVSDNEWEIHNAKGKIDDVRVVLVKGRYRFELELGNKISRDKIIKKVKARLKVSSMFKAYHGSPYDFDEFTFKNLGLNDPGDYGQGFYFDTNKDWAKSYARGQNGTLYFCELHLSNPYYIDFKKYDHYKTKKNKRELTEGEENIELNKYKEALKDGGITTTEDNFLSISRKYGSKNITKALEKAGYDGVVVNYGSSKEIVAFDNKKIKILEKNKVNDKEAKKEIIPPYMEEAIKKYYKKKKAALQEAGSFSFRKPFDKKEVLEHAKKYKGKLVKESISEYDGDTDFLFVFPNAQLSQKCVLEAKQIKGWTASGQQEYEGKEGFIEDSNVRFIVNSLKKLRLKETMFFKQKDYDSPANKQNYGYLQDQLLETFKDLYSSDKSEDKKEFKKQYNLEKNRDSTILIEKLDSWIKTWG